MDYFREWLKTPFQQEMDTIHWFMFLGLLLVMAGLWHRVLKHLGEGF